MPDRNQFANAVAEALDHYYATEDVSKAKQCHSTLQDQLKNGNLHIAQVVQVPQVEKLYLAMAAAYRDPDMNWLQSVSTTGYFILSTLLYLTDDQSDIINLRKDRFLLLQYSDDALFFTARRALATDVEKKAHWLSSIGQQGRDNSTWQRLHMMEFTDGYMIKPFMSQLQIDGFNHEWQELESKREAGYFREKANEDNPTEKEVAQRGEQYHIALAKSLTERIQKKGSLDL